MADRLLTSSDIQTLIGLGSPQAAESLMDKWGLPFVNLGPGRGRGKRWEKSAVKEAIKKRLRYPATQEKPKKKSLDAEAIKFFSLPPKEARALTFGKASA